MAVEAGSEGQAPGTPPPPSENPDSAAAAGDAAKQDEASRARSASAVSSEFDYADDFESSGTPGTAPNTAGPPLSGTPEEPGPSLTEGIIDEAKWAEIGGEPAAAEAGGGAGAGGGETSGESAPGTAEAPAEGTGGEGEGKMPPMRGPPPPAQELEAISAAEEPAQPVILSQEEEAAQLLAKDPEEVSTAKQKVPDELSASDRAKKTLKGLSLRKRTFRAMKDTKSALVPMRIIFGKLSEGRATVDRAHMVTVFKTNPMVQALLMKPVRISQENDEEEFLADVLYDLEDDGPGELEFGDLCEYFGYEWTEQDEADHRASDAGPKAPSPVAEDPAQDTPSPEPAPAGEEPAAPAARTPSPPAEAAPASSSPAEEPAAPPARTPSPPTEPAAPPAARTPSPPAEAPPAQPAARSMSVSMPGAFAPVVGGELLLQAMRRVFDHLAAASGGGGLPPGTCDRLSLVGSIRSVAPIWGLRGEPAVQIVGGRSESLAEVLENIETDGAGPINFAGLCSYFGLREGDVPPPPDESAVPPLVGYRSLPSTADNIIPIVTAFHQLAAQAGGKDGPAKAVRTDALVSALWASKAAMARAGENARATLATGEVETFGQIVVSFESETAPPEMSFEEVLAHFGMAPRAVPSAEDLGWVAMNSAPSMLKPIVGLMMELCAVAASDVHTRAPVTDVARLADFRGAADRARLCAALRTAPEGALNLGRDVRRRVADDRGETLGEVLDRVEDDAGKGPITLPQFLEYFNVSPDDIPWSDDRVEGGVTPRTTGYTWIRNPENQQAVNAMASMFVGIGATPRGKVDRLELLTAIKNTGPLAALAKKWARSRQGDGKKEKYSQVFKHMEEDGPGVITLSQFMAYFGVPDDDIPTAGSGLMAPSPVPMAEGLARAAGGASEGWGDDRPSTGGSAGGRRGAGGIERFDDGALLAAAEAASLANTTSRGYTPAAGSTDGIQRVRMVFERLARRGGGKSTGTVPRADLAAAFRSEPELAELRPRPARTHIETGREETFGDTFDHVESEGVDDMSMEDLLGYFGMGGPSRDERARRSLASGAGVALRYDDEASLIRDLQNELAKDLDGAAKLVILGGVGASQARRSVFRSWPRVWQKHIDNAALHVVRLADMGITEEDELPPPPSERAEFEHMKGAEYLLGDMHVLDVGTLHWSRPTTVGSMGAPRCGHTANFFPTRVHGEPLAVEASPYPSGARAQVIDDAGALLHMGSVQVSTLFEHLARIVAECGEGLPPATIGRIVLETLLFAWKKIAAVRSSDGYVSEHMAREVLISLLSVSKDEVDLAAPSDLAAVPRPTELTADRVLSRADNIEPPREDGSRSLEAIKQTLARDMALIKALPGAVCAAARRSTGTTDSVVVRVEEVSLDKAPEGLDMLWVVVELAAHPVSRGTSKEVPYLGEGKENSAAVGFERVYSLRDDDIRRALVAVVEGRQPPQVLLKVQGWQEEEDGQQSAADRLPVDIGFATVSLATLLERGLDFMGEEIDVLSHDGSLVGSIKVSLLAARCLRALVRSQRRAYLDAFDVIVFGGRVSGPRRDDETHALSPVNDLVVYDAAANQWSSVPPKGASPPSARFDHAACRHGGDLYIFGGTDGANFFNDVHVVDVRAGASRGTWRAVDPPGIRPTLRAGMSGTLVEAAGAGADSTWIIYTGGGDANGYFSDIQVLDVTDGLEGGPRWLLPTVSGMLPPKRRGHAAALMRFGLSETASDWAIYTFGGRATHVERREIDGQMYTINQDVTSNQLHCLKPVYSDDPFERSLLRFEWSVPPVRGRLPPPRESASMVTVGQKLVVSHGWAGVERAPWVRDFWIIDLASLTWCSLAFSDNYPSARYGHAVALCDYRQSVASNATLFGQVLQRDSLGQLFIEVDAGEVVEMGVQARDIRGLPAERSGDVFQAKLCPTYVRPGSRASMGAPQAGGLDGGAAGGGSPQGSPTGRLSTGTTPRVRPPKPTMVQQARMEDHGDGTYRLSFCPVQAGEIELHVTGEKGEQIRRSPVRVVIIPGPVSVKRCTVGGPGLATLAPGVQADIKVTARDAYGNLVDAHPREFSVEVVGPEKPQLTCVPGLMGMLGYKFMVTKSGEYELRVLHVATGAHVSGSPFTLACHAGKAFEKESTATGKALGGRWHAGLQAQIVVTARDVFGNGLKHGGDSFACKYQTTLKKDIKAPVEDGKVRDNGDGTYTCTVMPAESGTCRIWVKLLNENSDYREGDPLEEEDDGIKDSPYVLDVSSGLMSSSHTIVSGMAAEVEAGEAAEFTVTTRDKLGNPLGGGNDHIYAWAVPPQGPTHKVDADVTDNGDGTYRCRFQPRHSGRHYVHVEAKCGFSENPKQEKVGRSPYQLAVQPGPTDPKRCTAHGSGVYGLGKARNPAQVIVTARDMFGNQRPRGGDPIAVSVWCGWDVPVDLVDNNDGTYVGTYYTGEEDEYLGRMVYVVSVLVGERHVINSPFYHSIAPTPTSASHSEVTSMPPLLTAGETSEFKLQAIDEDGKKCLRGMDNFTLQVLGNDSAYGDVKDMKDGTYVIRVIAEEKAYYQVQLVMQLEGRNIKGSPFNVTVVPTGLFNVGFWGGFRMMDEEAAESFMLTGPGLEQTSAGERAEFDILSKRVQESTPGDDFVLELRGPEFVPGVVEGPEEGGVYRATYCATVAGMYVGTVKLGRFQLHGCPFQLKVSPSVTSPGACELSGPGLSACVATIETHFVLSTFDMHGNATVREDDSFEVYVKGGGKIGKGKVARWQKAEVTGTYENNRDGTYTMRYVVPFEGSFSVEIYHSRGPGKPRGLCKGCPFSVVAAKAPKQEGPKVDEAERRRLDAIEAQEAAVRAAMSAAAEAAGGQDRLEELATKNTETAKKRGGGIFGRMRADSMAGSAPGTARTSAAGGRRGSRSGAGDDDMATAPKEVFSLGFWAVGEDLLKEVAVQFGSSSAGGTRVHMRRSGQLGTLSKLTEDFMTAGGVGGAKGRNARPSTGEEIS